MLRYPQWIARLIVLIGCLFTTASATVSVPSLFTDHMVLQRNLENPVWGQASPGGAVTVTIADQSHHTVADSEGKWSVTLDPMAAGGPYELIIRGETTLTLNDVLIGEVWFCSGQSNMQWSVSRSNHAELEIASANFPEIRLLTVARAASQEPLDDFAGEWQICTPETVADFSAVGYFFGRRLHHALGVPIGLVDNAWGGSAAEAWVPREVLEAFPRYAAYLEHHDTLSENYSDAIHADKMAQWRQAVAQWEAGGSQGRRPRAPRDPRGSQHRPANLYNGVLHPTIGYGMRGFIWYQGEANASRAADYAHLFPLLIQTFREEWAQGDFPFYWVQLADYKEERPLPEDSDWARLRASQTATLDVLPNAGQAVIIDAGEGRDIHPRDKQIVANRLARIALARDYDFEIDYKSPRFEEMRAEGNKLHLSFSGVSEGGLYAFDTRAIDGFAIAGEDRQFVWAEAEIVGNNQVRVWSDAVSDPVAVRYAWADNPVANLYDRNGLPVTPFRTDDWPRAKPED